MKQPLFVKALIHTFQLEIEEDATFGDLKTMIFEKTRFPIDSQRIRISGREVLNTDTLKQHEAHQQGTIHVIVRLREAVLDTQESAIPASCTLFSSTTQLNEPKAEEALRPSP